MSWKEFYDNLEIWQSALIVLGMLTFFTVIALVFIFVGKKLYKMMKKRKSTGNGQGEEIPALKDFDKTPQPIGVSL